MSKTNVSTCVVCGKEYETCLSCKKEMAAKPWRSVADSVECYKLFLVLSRYGNGHLSADEAKKQLQGIKYDLEALKPSVQDTIGKILKDGSATKKTTTKEKSAKSDEKCE